MGDLLTSQPFRDLVNKTLDAHTNHTIDLIVTLIEQMDGMSAKEIAAQIAQLKKATE